MGVMVPCENILDKAIEERSKANHLKADRLYIILLVSCSVYSSIVRVDLADSSDLRDICSQLIVCISSDIRGYLFFITMAVKVAFST